jgi:hypothetical protein
MGSVRLVGLGLALVFMVASPALAKQSTSINQRENVELQAGVGDTLVRVTLKESLPNALGGSDIFGRKRDRGFVEFRYMGQSPDGLAIFHRKDVAIYSNETTMSRTPMTYGQATITPNYAGGATVSGYTVGPAQSTTQALPPDTIEIRLDLSRILTVEDRQIEILSAESGSVAFRILKRK